MTHVFKHPKYYKELRDAGTELAKRNAVKQHLDLYPGSSPVRNKTDQVISKEPATAGNQRAPGPGLKHQASSSKLTETNCHDDKNQEQQASSRKLQAPSSKRQASSRKRQAP